MTSFDLAEVRKFTANLTLRMKQCENGEGIECATLEDSLRHHARLCCELRDRIRDWGRSVFTGKVAFDPEVQRVWLDEGFELYYRAKESLIYGEIAEVPCYVLEGKSILQSALWELGLLLENWVSPSLSVSPSARQGLAVNPEVLQEARTRVSNLPLLPPDWRPSDARQQGQLRRLKSRKIS